VDQSSDGSTPQETHVALRLFDAGYTDLVPVAPPSATLRPGSTLAAGKAPAIRLSDGTWTGMTDWQNLEIDRGGVAKRASYGASFGLRTKHFPAIDVDVLDDQISADVKGALIDFFGSGMPPVRTGLAPKFLLPGRTEAPFKKITLALTNANNKPCGNVEILGDGQQFVCSGIHPTTQQPYRWEHQGRAGGAEILADVGPASLPLLTPEVVSRLGAHLTRRLAQRRIRVRQKGTGQEAAQADV
jgi:hypothetical protein